MDAYYLRKKRLLRLGRLHLALTLSGILLLGLLLPALFARRWKLALILCGLLAVVIAGFLLLAGADRKEKALQAYSFPVSDPAAFLVRLEKAVAARPLEMGAFGTMKRGKTEIRYLRLTRRDPALALSVQRKRLCQAGGLWPGQVSLNNSIVQTTLAVYPETWNAPVSSPQKHSALLMRRAVPIVDAVLLLGEKRLLLPMYPRAAASELGTLRKYAAVTELYLELLP